MGPIPRYSQPISILWSLSYEGYPGKPLKFSGGEEPGPFRRVLRVRQFRTKTLFNAADRREVPNRLTNLHPGSQPLLPILQRRTLRARRANP